MVTQREYAPVISGRGSFARGGFTIIETLVVISILAFLVSILLPAINSARESAKHLVCAANMRSITREFDFFVRGESANGQGDSEKLGPNRFRIDDFQEQLYGIDEFWDLGDKTSAPVMSSANVMLCPSGRARLTKRKGFPCGRESITPIKGVTLAMNKRLQRAEVNFHGKTVLAPVRSTRVSATILNRPYVPIVMEIDGERASAAGIDPFYMAPPGSNGEGPFSSGRFWIPSKRHGGRVNVAFTGGHVLSSKTPERERWDWDYQAGIGR